MKDHGQVDKQEVASLWHIPNERELLSVDEIIDTHLKKPLVCLKKISGGEKDGYKFGNAGFIVLISQ